jgi:hypothetical protein
MELTGGAQRVRPYDLGAIGVYPETATSIYPTKYKNLSLHMYQAETPCQFTNCHYMVLQPDQ